MKRIYLDHAATTSLDKRVFEKMTPYFLDVYGNANSQHGYGRDAQKAVDEARDTIAKLIGAKPNEIYFTSGGTESDNWALRGTVKALKEKGNHIIMSCIEHAAMLSTAKELEKDGVEVSLIGVDEQGFINLDELKKAIRPTTVLISCMYANNEIGTIEQEVDKIIFLYRDEYYNRDTMYKGIIELNLAKSSRGKTGTVRMAFIGDACIVANLSNGK